MKEFFVVLFRILKMIPVIIRKIWSVLKFIYEVLCMLPPFISAFFSIALCIAIQVILGSFVFCICGGGMTGGVGAFLVLAVSWAMLGL